MLSEKMKQKRDEFIEELYERVCEESESATFRTHAFHVIASIGLQRSAKEEGLFDNIKWSSFIEREKFLEKVHTFLKTHIK